MCVFQFATQHRFLLIDVWGGEYEAHASATSVCISFRGHMGSGVTATPVTVTVATFGTMAFYEMKLKIHREPEIKKIFSSWAYTVTMELRYKTELISSSDSKEYHGCLNITCEKEEGKKSLFLQCTLSPLSSMLWRFLQANDHRIFFGELCTLSFHAFSSELWCNASKWLAGDGREDLACCTVFVSPANPRILICLYVLT